jgi:hypothetical protein
LSRRLTMEWTRSDTIALAAQNCCQCHGLGLKTGLRSQPTPCNCVLRAIFRVCYARFRHCATKEKHMSRACPELISGKEGKLVWGRKDEEYIADFCLVSRRALDDFEYSIFKFHFLLGADWKLCTRRLAVDRGNFFHAVYRIEQKLGRIFIELEPYGLYPLNEYFHGARKVSPQRAAFLNGLAPSVVSTRLSFQPPLLRTA